MLKAIYIISNDEESIFYKNAYWKSSTTLAIKVDLKANFEYKIMLGSPKYGRFMSYEDLELPVTHWKFKTTTK